MHPDVSRLLQSAPALTRVHCDDFGAKRFSHDESGHYDWHAPRSPAEDKGNSGMMSAREWWTCGYCGSMHPTELVVALGAGAKVHWADFKYGWPHKLYVENAPNRYAGELEIRSGAFCGNPPKDELERGEWTRYQNGFSPTTGEPTYSYRKLGEPQPARETTTGKFYTLHLQDATPEERDVIERAMGLRFEFLSDGRLRWSGVGTLTPESPRG